MWSTIVFLRRVSRLVFILIILVGTAAYFIWVFPPPKICPIETEPGVLDSWNSGPAMPTARSELAAAVLDGMIYAAGGLRMTGASQAFHRFDPASQRWQELADLPNRVHHATLTAVGNKLYLAGGFEGNSLSRQTDSVWVYSPGEDKWSQAESMPSARAAHAAALLNDRLYIVGGVGLGSNFLWAYEPETNSWEVLPTTLPTPREHLAAVVLNDKLYAIGGRTAEGGNLDAVEIYDPARGSWVRAAAMPTARGGLTAGAVNGRIHVAGGEDFFTRPNCTYQQHEAYDPLTDTWSVLPPMPTPRHGLASGVVGDLWYVIGGAEKPNSLTLVSTSDKVEIFQP